MLKTLKTGGSLQCMTGLGYAICRDASGEQVYVIEWCMLNVQ